MARLGGLPGKSGAGQEEEDQAILQDNCIICVIKPLISSRVDFKMFQPKTTKGSCPKWFRRLGLEHFKINPARNQGLDYAYDAVVRKKDDRKCALNGSSSGSISGTN
jgi:hypothetical protein